MTGTIVTFYSYKGGVGRSFALANTALLLARWGYRVLTIDWDLEAPGLHEYFKPLLPRDPDAGVIDLAYEFLAGSADPPPHEIALELDERTPGSVALLAAGRRNENYPGRVQAINWEELYLRGFAAFLERRREEWAERYDFVLIDSRTGYSDIGGICTAQLPDRLVLLFTANEQSVTGAVEAARLADQARDSLPYDRAPHLVLPVLSRLDNRVEYEQSEKWKDLCTEHVEPLFRNWLAKSVPARLMVQHLTVPYVSFWSFGERLPVLSERVPSPDQISYALETVAAVIAQQFEWTDLLADNRDAYVTRVRSRERTYDLDLLVSCPRSAVGVATELVGELRALGLKADRSWSGDPELLDRTVDAARHLCLVVDGEVSRWQLTEAEWFLRRALDSDADRQLFSVLTRGTSGGVLPPILRNVQHVQLETGVRPRQVARKLSEFISVTPPNRSEAELTALQDAGSALRRVPDRTASRLRWSLIEETVGGMSAALDSGDLDLLRDFTVDLELLDEVHANGARFTSPDSLTKPLKLLLDRIDRRIIVFTE